MDLHCGNISATSAGKGRGTTLTVELPVVQRIRDPTIHSDNFSELRPKERQEVVVAPINPSDSMVERIALDDVEDVENTPPMKCLRTALVVDDSGPTRKMICRCPVLPNLHPY